MISLKVHSKYSEKRLFLALISVFVGMTLLSCDTNKQTDFDQLEEEILQLHEQQRDFHFQKDSIAFARQLSPDFISVNRGEISKPTEEQTLKRYHNYFSNVEFIKWDDVSKPVIRFSDDGSLAYTIVDKIVEVAYRNEEGETIKGQTHFAWTAIYRKTEDGWKIECVSSTNKPDREELEE
ncbi:nuclear transport factor 2 family protein [Flagellimonas allohymeniacidonis]|nr:nuclear transport factor 2 family protein [Allomuricauda hymeniacidonis]